MKKVVQVQVSTGTHGHMNKTKKQIAEDLKLIDVVVEILDARIPKSSQNPELQELIKNKNKIIVLNKSDLSDEKTNQKWLQYFKKQNITALLSESNSGKGINDVISQIRKIAQEENEKTLQKGRAGKKVKVMIVGIPNVGKSSLINRITKKNSAKVGNKPGITKQKQWITIEKNISLLDTPGILWPKLNQEEVALNLAFTGTIKDEILSKLDIAYYLLKYLLENYNRNLINRYSLDQKEIEDILNNTNNMENENIMEIMDLIGKKRGAIVSGGKIDREKVANIILEDFRSGKLGKISLEEPEL